MDFITRGIVRDKDIAQVSKNCFSVCFSFNICQRREPAIQFYPTRPLHLSGFYLLNFSATIATATGKATPKPSQRYLLPLLSIRSTRQSLNPPTHQRTSKCAARKPYVSYVATLRWELSSSAQPTNGRCAVTRPVKSKQRKIMQCVLHATSPT